MSEHDETQTQDGERDELSERREEMQSEEGHSGSIPRGNQDRDDQDVERGEEKTDRLGN